MKYQVLTLLLIISAPMSAIASRQHKAAIPQNAVEHFRAARQLEGKAEDLLAEIEYKKAIMIANGYYPQAWRNLCWNLARRLKFSEAAFAMSKYSKQDALNVTNNDIETRSQLLQAAKLQKLINNSARPPLKSLLEYSSIVFQFATNNRITETLPFAEKAIVLYPTSAKALTLLASLLGYSSQQDERRLELLKRAIAIDSNNIEAYYEIGKYYALIDADSSINAFQKAIELSQGRHGESWQGLARLYKKLGKKQEAIEAFRAYLKYGNNLGPYRLEIENEIKDLENK